MALQADAWHLRTDVYTSLGVMFGLLVIWIAGIISPTPNLSWLDPVVAIAVALLIIKAAYDLLREAARDLARRQPSSGRRDWISDFVMAGWPTCVASTTSAPARRAPIASSTSIWSSTTSMSVGEAHALGDEVVVAIKERLPSSRVYIHIEPCDYSCGDSCAGGCAVDWRRGTPSRVNEREDV